MTKKIVFLFALLLSFQWVAAQSVSDEQVIKIVMTERERGSDEKTIAQKLLRQGVTPAQLRRIKAKYDQEQEGLGAVDITTIKRNRNASDKNAAVNDRIAGWDTNGTITIEFDLVQKVNFKRAELFYAGAMRDVTVYVSSDGVNYRKGGFFAAQKGEYIKYGLQKKTLELTSSAPDTVKVKLEFAPTPVPGAIEQKEIPKVHSRNALLSQVPWKKANFILAEIELWQAE